MTKKLLVIVDHKGGTGSGNWGHSGRPGLVGGSGGRASTGAGSIASIKTNANKVATEQIDAIVEGSRKVGEEYFGATGVDKLEWSDTREHFGDNVDVVTLNERMEEVDYEPSDEFAQLLDDFEYLYVFNGNTGKSSKLPAYTEHYENIRPEHIKSFYDNEAKPGDLVVSYWAEAAPQIIVPD